MGKVIIVCGGVISGCGKGVAAASIALLLNKRGCSVDMIKFDPYLSPNAGCLAPREHGEVFLCDDGTECDLDLGHYQRIANINLSKDNIFTSGKLYKELIERQEYGTYLGTSLQVIPHLTNLIIEKISNLNDKADIVVVEIGGTVGDIESQAFYKAISQLKNQMKDDCIITMVAPILWIETIKEFKTKPLQRSVNDLQSFGIQPDILLCRVDRPVPEGILKKISSMTYIPMNHIFDAPDVSTIYQVPIELYNRHVDDLIADRLHLKRDGVRIHKYRDLVEKYVNDDELKVIQIGIIGKYDNCDEAYISLKEAIYHAAIANNVKARVRWISADTIESYKDMRGVWAHFEDLNGVIVPGGFDSRGIEGKIRAIQYVREKKIPFLGICLGLQCAVIEFARNVLKLEGANSIEFDKDCANPVIHFVDGQEGLKKKCSTMRLGAFNCRLKRGTLVRSLYKRALISERHRHRYEVNSFYEDALKNKDFIVSGVNPDNKLIEMMEFRDHPFFIGTQSHPEFKSRLDDPNPLFYGLVKAASEHR